MTENNYACKDNLWAHCGAPGEALRRASEAEAKVKALEEKLESKEMWEQEMWDGGYGGDD